MAKHVMQFRYYEDNHTNNQPVELNAGQLVNGTVFAKYLPFTQLGIQALPGTRFYLNDNIEGPVIVGSTGIYELDLEGLSEITAISFDASSIASISSNDSAYLIVDIVYNQDDEEETV